MAWAKMATDASWPGPPGPGPGTEPSAPDPGSRAWTPGPEPHQEATVLLNTFPRGYRVAAGHGRLPRDTARYPHTSRLPGRASMQMAARDDTGGLAGRGGGPRAWATGPGPRGLGPGPGPRGGA